MNSMESKTKGSIVAGVVTEILTTGGLLFLVGVILPDIIHSMVGVSSNTTETPNWTWAVLGILWLAWSTWVTLDLRRKLAELENSKAREK